jgi:quinol monooxygenase YgiN
LVLSAQIFSASRRESGNLGYDIYRGIDDDQEFYIVKHWASPAALAAHERSEASSSSVRACLHVNEMIATSKQLSKFAI